MPSVWRNPPCRSLCLLPTIVEGLLLFLRLRFSRRDDVDPNLVVRLVDVQSLEVFSRGISDVHGLDSRLIDDRRPRIVRRRVHGLIVLHRGLKVLRDPVAIFPHLLGAIRKVSAVYGLRAGPSSKAHRCAEYNGKALAANTLLAMSGNHPCFV